MALIISTLNIFSFNNKNKIMFIREFLDKNRIDICFIQETHIHDINIFNNVKETFSSYEFFSTLTTTNSRGVCIFIKRERNIKIMNEYFDCENRMHGIEVSFENTTFNFINIYAPNSSTSQCEFIQTLYTYLSSKKNIILGGDFNYIEDREYEKKNNTYWKDFYKNFNLVEFEWSVPNLLKKDCYTWAKNENLKSRIDRFYCEKYFVKNCEYKNICETSMSDHRMVICQIKLNNKSTKINKNILWKLNESVLEHQHVNEGIIKLCETIPSLIEKNKNLKNGWYDIFINKVCNFLKHESRIINNNKKQEMNECFNRLKEMDSMSEIKDMNAKKNEVREKINKHFETIRLGNEKRMRNERLKFVKQPTKVLMQQERKNNASCIINNYETSEGVKTNELEKIKEDVFNFYNNLLGIDRISDETINNYEFNIKSMNVDECVKNLINNEISVDEVERVIKKMKESAPGNTGLTIGFYKKYFKYFGKYFVEILNSEDELPLLFKESIVKLIPKNNNDVKTINDLRPISLTNIDYRIYTKVLANRLRIIADKIIGDHQTCSIKGRRIMDNLNLIRDVISESDYTGFELFILSVDQSKAFDRISHKYLFKLLEHINFGDFILRGIKRMYDNSCAKIVVNNTLCEEIKIESGLKQGCALSMLLYIMCIEELVVRIKNNIHIKGYILNTTNKHECKAGGYADDIAGLLTNYECIEPFFNEFKEWGRVSSAILNVEKTKILALNSNYKEFKGIKFINTLKILGIEFNNKGVTINNIQKVLENIKKSVAIWDGVRLNIIERVVVSKTFILSKLWYIINFITLSEENIRMIESMIHKFIWSNSMELIKRNTLILPYESGGLNSVCLRAKIETSQIQNYINILNNNERMFYQISSKYLKFELRETNIFKNFNLIPACNKRPKIYNEISKSVKRIRSIDSYFFNNIKKYNSKYTYNKLLDSYSIKPKIESWDVCDDWSSVYKNIHNAIENSDMRAFLYKLIFHALPVENRFNYKKNMCFFCVKNKEDVSHVFYNCHKTNSLFDLVKEQLDERNFILSKHSFWFNITLSKHDYKYISIFLYSVWLVREKLRKGTKSDIKILFNNIFINQLNNM